MDNLMPICVLLMNLSLQVDIVCSITPIASIEVTKDTDFLEDFTIVV
jgi:hypothetical protein